MCCFDQQRKIPLLNILSGDQKQMASTNSMFFSVTGQNQLLADFYHRKKNAKLWFWNS